MKMIAENPGNYQGWMTDHAGQLRVAFAIVDGVNTTNFISRNRTR